MIRRHDEREARLAEHFKVLWSMRAPQEVPTIDGEWEFIAVWTPEIADREPEQDSR